VWQLPGNRGVGIVADGYALVTDGEEAGEYRMIDTDTGEMIEGQVWDDGGLFSSGCCGDDHNVVYRSNGAVVTIHDRVVSVFVPSDTEVEPQEVTLP
jgi:hypothetical protein